MATEQIERPTDVIDLVKREDHSRAAFHSNEIRALTDYIEQLEQLVKDLKDSQTIEVKGNAVLEGVWEFWNNEWEKWLKWHNDPQASSIDTYLVRKRKATKEDRFRKALDERHPLCCNSSYAIDAAKEAGLL